LSWVIFDSVIPLLFWLF